MKLSVIKVEEKRAVLDFFGSKLICSLSSFAGTVSENDVVYLKDGLFYTDEEETERVKAKNYCRIHRIKEKQ